MFMKDKILIPWHNFLPFSQLPENCHEFIQFQTSLVNVSTAFTCWYKMRRKLGSGCKCTFGLSSLVVSLTTFVCFVYSTSFLDHWMVNERITSEQSSGVHHHRNTLTKLIPHITPERVRYFGVWTVCDFQDKHRCTDTDMFVRNHILQSSLESPYWVHILRFFIVIALICVGIAVIIATHAVINNSNTISLVYLLNIFGLFMMTSVLVYMHFCLPHYMPSYYRFTTSYVMTWAVVAGAYLYTGAYLLSRYWIKSNTESWRPWQDV